MFLTPEKKSWFILSSVFILALLLNIDYSAVNLILVPISRDFDEDLNVLQWLLSGYTLAWASVAIIGGRLSDIYGRRRMFFIGVWIFSIASLICGVAWDTWVIMLGRALQGVGGGLFVSPLYAIIFMETPEDKRGRSMGILGISCGIGLAFGPSIGGALLEWLSWRWIFYINIPLCLIAQGVMYIFTHKETIDSTKKKIDIQGAALLGATIIMFLFSINQAEVWGLGSLLFWSFIGISILLFFAFLTHQSNRENRLIPKNFFNNTPYLGCLVGFSFFQYVFASMLLMVNLYLQNILNYSAYETGIIFFSMTIALGLLSPFGGKMCDRMDGRIPICLGTFITGIAALWFSTFDAHTELLPVIFSLALAGTGLGISFPSFNAVMLKTVDSSLLNTASGVFSVGTCMSLSLGVIISSSMLTGLGQIFLEQTLPLNLSPEDYSSLITYIAGVHHDIKELENIVDAKAMNTLVKSAYTTALSVTMQIAAAVSFISTLFCFLTIKGIKK